ncbi:hypothetical protein CRP19_000031 [Riemerella phage vB_RanS_CRP19]|nr:hypothetical protein CRP19_000031 [Riemerella phage vB_RanS_CRP19]
MNEEKQLYLVLTREWFNEILSGRKKEEYRAFTDFYIRRLAVIDKDGDLIDTRSQGTDVTNLSFLLWCRANASGDLKRVIKEFPDTERILFEYDYEKQNKAI